MNNTLESVMSFINENTTILISICIFLIFVLVVYLIRSAVKAKNIDKIKKEEELKTKKLVNDHIEKVKEEEIKKEKENVEKINISAFDLEKEEEPKSVDVLYKNDKKLSDILFDEIDQPEGKLDYSIVKKEEEIEQLNSVDELEEIMKKLNNYNSKTKN